MINAKKFAGFFRKPLRLKLVAAVYLLTLSVLGLLMYQTNKEALHLVEEQFSNHQMSIAKQTAVGIEKNITSLVRGLLFLSEILSAEDLSREEIRKTMAETFEYVKRMYVSDLAFIDQDGILRVSMKAPHMEGVNHSFKEHFTKAKALKMKDVIFEFIPLAGIYLGQKGVNIAVPVFKQSDRFFGVLFFTVRISELISSYLPLDMLGASSCVINERGEFLCNPKKLKRSSSTEALTGEFSFGSLVADIETSNIFMDKDRKLVEDNMITVTYPVRIADQTWNVRISTPEETLRNLLSPFTKKFALVSLALLVMIVATSLFIMRLINDWNIELDREIKKSNRELLISREKHRAILETASDLIWETDTGGRYTYASPASTKILGYRPEELIGTTLYDLMGDEDAQRIKQSLADVARSKKPFSGLQWTCLNREGDPLAFETNGSPILDESGKVLGFRGADREISRRKKAENELRLYAVELEEARSNLESKVEERTRELKKAHDELVVKEKFAAIGELASSVSHELRNPLGVIKNAVYFFNLKIDSFSDETVRENIRIITREIDHANRVISELLDFTRNKAPVRLAVNINQLTQEILDRPTIPDNITVVTDFTDRMPSISIDPTQVAQVFINLVENALQSMEAGGGTLSVSTRADGNGCEIVFKDEGCGIAPQDLDHIFSPLFTTKTKGIGLGLAIAKSMAVANNGDIFAESTPGKGSTFTVRFGL